MVFVGLEESKLYPVLRLREKPQSVRRAQIKSPFNTGRAGSQSRSLGTQDFLLVPKPQQWPLSGQLQTAREVPSSNRKLRFSPWH